MTENDVGGGGHWIEMTPVVPSPATTGTVTPTKAKALDLPIDSGIVLLALVLGVVGLVSVVAIIYLTRQKEKV
jgi:hypothetical protein